MWPGNTAGMRHSAGIRRESNNIANYEGAGKAYRYAFGTIRKMLGRTVWKSGISCGFLRFQRALFDVECLTMHRGFSV